MPEGIDLVIRALKVRLIPHADKSKDLLLLEGRYLDNNRQLLQGIISNEDAQLEFNRIRKDLLHFIDSLQKVHLLSEGGELPADRPDIYNGEVMYRIPDQMTQGQEVKCIVRLAFDRNVLMEGLTEQPGDVLKDLRISDVMGVELLDAGSHAFSIRTVSDTVQFMERDLHTEWLFYVVPLKAGTHPLLLKISVIEIRNGIERKRNVVLEESVEVLTSSPVVETETSFTSAGYALRLAVGALPGDSIPESALPDELERMPPLPDAAAAIDTDLVANKERAGQNPAPRPAAANKRKSITARLAPVIGALALVLVAVWALRLGFTAKLDSTETINGGVEESSVSPAQENEKANFEIVLEEEGLDSASMEAALKAIELAPAAKQDFLDYVEKNPAGDVAAFAKQKIDSIEHAIWDSVAVSRDTAALLEFIKTFPKGQHAKDASSLLRQIEKAKIKQLEQ